ncbi:MAG: ORF6N domain-containing protein [Prolixibacteraceae bacterium]|nr:ORF6N domain-containing protein [Prolixibacteraceae bacterium]
MENIELIEIGNRIFTIRGVQVMLERHLTEMYKVDNKRLNEQIKRNLDSFLSLFVFN